MENGALFGIQGRLHAPVDAAPLVGHRSDMDPTILFETVDDWEAWLAAHGGTSRGVWLELAKKGAVRRSVTYAEALEIALRHGWIDAQKKGLDEATWLQRFTPRGSRSIWSQRNREHAERLIAGGHMTPAGLAAVEAARSDGRWEAAYPGQRDATVPEDLRAALDASPDADALFATLNARNRYAILHRVLTAKRPETRASRIEKLVAMLARGETIYPR